ncbi:hypothetical protein K2173_020378 [Erythroxylum novogranatense]|uniref:Uncharacterized protein n=1 Tax=Erythroxylum novogranatense TaxID=1862640 RepID=A0AAV8TG48_9ROSI|nr:hypothetical protein K2173_020378 [Erythroxylum novogranatense]
MNDIWIGPTHDPTPTHDAILCSLTTSLTPPVSLRPLSCVFTVDRLKWRRVKEGCLRLIFFFLKELLQFFLFLFGCLAGEEIRGRGTENNRKVCSDILFRIEQHHL